MSGWCVTETKKQTIWGPALFRLQIRPGGDGEGEKEKQKKAAASQVRAISVTQTGMEGWAGARGNPASGKGPLWLPIGWRGLGLVISGGGDRGGKNGWVRRRLRKKGAGVFGTPFLLLPRKKNAMRGNEKKKGGLKKRGGQGFFVFLPLCKHVLN